MSELPIVFARGQNESIDPRVLPVDQHKTVKNIRFRKDGRPQKRSALRAVSTTNSVAPGLFPQFATEYSGARCFGAGGYTQTFVPGYGWQNFNIQPVSLWGPGERRPLWRNENAASQPSQPTVTYTAGGVVISAFVINGFVTFQSTLRGGSGASPSSTARTIVSGTHPRLLTVNGITYCFYINVSNLLRCVVYTAATDTFATTTTLQSITGGGSYDVVAHGSTEFVIIWQNSLVQLSVARYSAATVPAIVGSALNIATNSSAQFPSIACTSTSSIFVAWLEKTATPSVKFAAFDSTLTTQTGATTTLATTAGLFDQPGVVVQNNTTATILYGGYVSPTSFLFGAQVTNASVVNATSTQPNIRLSSKPFTISQQPFDVFVWGHSPEGTAWEDQRATYLLHYSVVGPVQAELRSRQLLVPNLFGTEVLTAGVPQGNTHLPDVVDSGVGFWTLQPTQLRALALGSAQLIGLDLVDFHSIYESQFYAARDVVTAGRALQVSGGTLAERAGVAFAETGFSSQPVIISATPVVLGSLSVGTYLYKVVFEYLDFAGRRARSATSDPISATTAGANLSVALVVSPLIADARDGNSLNSVTAHVYRSLVGQSTYHRVTPNSGAPVTGPSDSANFSYTDTLSDASAAAAEFIYTDGGVLDNSVPPASTFLCVCNGRVWLGGQFDRTVITASKLLVDSEPTQFSALSAFSVTLPRKCTGLASIDGTVVAFAADAIYLVNGNGPNNQGVGTFNPPTALPVDDGCVDWRSVVETAEGVFFQARRGIMVLPRGFNAPQFIGGPVEDTLRTYPLITSATLVAPTNGDETTVRFTCNDGGGVNPGATLIYNIRTQGWIVDTIQTGEIVGPGGTWLGQWVQTAVTSTGVLANIYEEPVTASYAEGAGNAFIPSILATGDLRPFGVAGYGNFESVTVMGEYRGNANVVVSVSVDGVTADTYTFAVTSADAADGVVYLDVTPKIRKGCSIAITIQDAAIGGVATEGFIAQAVYLEVEAMTGNKRLPAARRA